MKTVCVTGASGYIPSWLVKFLLQRGYTVKASVQDTDDENKTQRLLTFDRAKERLQLINADLLEEGSFDAVTDGCDGVFHTASLFLLSTSDPQVSFLDLQNYDTCESCPYLIILLIGWKTKEANVEST
ncbi:hypothetical protein CASFOL_021271 [Castilleja foliolosa]|uniref:NAD-dependent epimerase/dehydratase domain-containing protein n=1 Tax=Castilleja foliolosa TaxID=1961234 RepID=A0ABD3D073_9LAMI